MAPIGNPSLFMRFFGLVENFPLYGMLGIACGLAAYTPIKHLLTDADIALDTRARNFGDNLAENPRYLERAKRYYDNTILSDVSRLSNGTTHVLPDVGVPACPKLGDGTNYPGRWQPRIPTTSSMGAVTVPASS